MFNQFEDFKCYLFCLQNKNIFNLAISGDAIRIIRAGGFYINHQRVKKVDEVITESAHILPNLVSLLRVGKRNYYIVKWQT